MTKAATRAAATHEGGGVTRDLSGVQGPSRMLATRGLGRLGRQRTKARPIIPLVFALWSSATVHLGDVWLLPTKGRDSTCPAPHGLVESRPRAQMRLFPWRCGFIECRANKQASKGSMDYLRWLCSFPWAPSLSVVLNH